MASGPKEASSLPSHAVPAQVMQMMAKVKVKPATSEASLKPGRGVERGAHSAVPPPEASLRQFDLKLDLTGKSGLGLDVDWADGKTLFIKSVKPDGAVADYNATCPSGNAVQGGDRVIAINDRAGDAKAMLGEVRAKRQLHLVILTSREAPAQPAKPSAEAPSPDQLEASAPGVPRQHEFTVTLDMAGKTGLGLDVDWSDGKTLYIKSVKADGAVSDWNRRCALDDLVQGGDRVIAINGKTGAPKAMLAECRNKAHLQLTIKGQRESLSGRAQVVQEAAPERRASTPGEAKASDAAEAAKAPARPQRVPKPHEFIVWLDMSRHATLGLDVDWADGKTLYINSVQAGAIQEWNHEHPLHQQVSAGDRIISVNGYADDPESMASLCKELVATQCRFQLLVRGPPPPPSAAGSPPPDPQGSEEKKGRKDKKAGKEKDKEEEKEEEKDKDKERREKKAKKGRDDSSGEDDEQAGRKGERKERKAKEEEKERPSKRSRRERGESDGEDSDEKEKREKRDREEKKARKKKEERRSP